MRGCIRQIESLKPSGASEAYIMNQAKMLLSQDAKYKHRFKFDHVWPILKDMQKFTDNETTTSPFQRDTGHFVASQEDSPTLESPTTASPRLSPFSLNMSSDDNGGSSSQRPIGVKKAKSKRRVDELNSTDFNTLKEGQEKLLDFYSINVMHRERLNDILERNMECLERKVECRETKIVMTDLNTITDPMKWEFMNRQQLKIMAKQARQQDQGSQNPSGSSRSFVILKACQLCESVNCPPNHIIIFESDSKSAVSWVNGDGGIGIVRLRNFILDIMDFLASHVSKIKVQFFSRSANGSADFLARQVASIGLVQVVSNSRLDPNKEVKAYEGIPKKENSSDEVKSQ
ncbi:hypothetical protein Ddye_025363 [Dipteronia dyeriana]|uniref:No apical meristem-associated C-terminal domain-containing protein n=1 Tax=Dipteronia dyeriana TaxID=168575 RepID=A0AAD9TXK1_9ROSI|nr:hypothetical protein Ddye_025363 [Dipteronia dyeriana]